jgi:hypothetical protein
MVARNAPNHVALGSFPKLRVAGSIPVVRSRDPRRDRLADGDDDRGSAVPEQGQARREQRERGPALHRRPVPAPRRIDARLRRPRGRDHSHGETRGETGAASSEKSSRGAHHSERHGGFDLGDDPLEPRPARLSASAMISARTRRPSRRRSVTVRRRGRAHGRARAPRRPSRRGTRGRRRARGSAARPGRRPAPRSRAAPPRPRGRP